MRFNGALVVIFRAVWLAKCGLERKKQTLPHYILDKRTCLISHTQSSIMVLKYVLDMRIEWWVLCSTREERFEETEETWLEVEDGSDMVKLVYSCLCEFPIGIAVAE